jgi:hypothetical protein
VLRGNSTGSASLSALFENKLPAVGPVPMQADQQIMGLGGIICLRQYDYIPLLTLVMSSDERNIPRLVSAKD